MRVDRSGKEIQKDFVHEEVSAVGNGGSVTLRLLVYPVEYPLGGPIERPQLGCIHKFQSLIGKGAANSQLSGPPSPSMLPKFEHTPRREAKATLAPSLGDFRSRPEEVLVRPDSSRTLEANTNTCPEQAGAWWVGGGVRVAQARSYTSASKT